MQSQVPISIRLDPSARAEIERAARASGVGVGTYLRQVALEHARDLRRREIRDRARAIGRQVAEDTSARSFVPLTDDVRYVIEPLAVRSEPTGENGCKVACYAVAHAPVTASKTRVARATTSRITDEQLRDIRQIVAEIMAFEISV